MFDWGSDWWLFPVIAISIGVLAVTFYYDNSYQRELMRKCLADGKPEYECYSMIYIRGHR